MDHPYVQGQFILEKPNCIIFLIQPLLETRTESCKRNYFGFLENLKTRKNLLRLTDLYEVFWDCSMRVVIYGGNFTNDETN